MGRSLALLLALALLAGCGPSRDPDAVLALGRTLPQAQFTQGDGSRVTVDALKGSPAVINFWATWCAPCREEIPVLQAAHADYQAHSVAFLAVTDELPTTVRPFRERLQMTLPIWYDPGGRAGEIYRIQSIPTTFFLDADGVLVARHVGALSRRELDQYLERIIADAPAEEQPAPTTAPAPAPAPTAPRLPANDGVGWLRPLVTRQS